jgi:hypothetical protein
MAQVRDPIDIVEWRGKAAIGAKVTYYRGFIASDRVGKSEIEWIADEAWSLAEQGLVALTQRKISDRLYDYVATAGSFRPWPSARERQRIASGADGSRERPVTVFVTTSPGIV